MWNLYLQLFITYFKIGLFNFGGGYAMISLIQHEIVEKNQWISTNEFTDIIAISQMTPGPIGVNSATYVGYQATLNNYLAMGNPVDNMAYLYAVLGSFISTFAVCLPSFILLLFIARLLVRFNTNKDVQNLFNGLRPAIVGLIGASVLMLIDAENFGSTQNELFRSIPIFIFVFIASWKYKMHPITLMLVAGGLGLILY